jgi:hypothetical protein
MPKPQNPQIYVIKVRARPGVDATKALRAALKIMGRSFGLTAVSVARDRDAELVEQMRPIDELNRAQSQ